MDQCDTVWLERLFRQHYLPLCRWIYRMVGDVGDTTELVQEAFLRLLSSGPAGGNRTANAGYLYRLAHNLAIDFLRKRAVRERYAQQVSSARVIRFPLTPEERLLQEERRCLVREALEELSQRQRFCLELRASGLSYEQIAVAINGNPDSVGPTLTRALRKFRLAYERLQRREPVEIKDADAK